MSGSAFCDNVVVLTGGSAGIGLELARQLSLEGAALVLAARAPALLDDAAEMCRANGDIAQRAIGPDGKTLGTRPVVKNAVMSAEESARQIIRAAAARRREIVMNRLARFAQAFKALAPSAVERLADRGVRRGR